jgi:hypothetical protein
MTGNRGKQRNPNSTDHGTEVPSSRTTGGSLRGGSWHVVADDRVDHVSTRADLDRACGGGMAVGGPWPRGRFTRVDLRSTSILVQLSIKDILSNSRCPRLYLMYLMYLISVLP